MDYDVIVVGGGPAGCAVARDIAFSGARVLLVEEHAQIGEPLQCAGLISERTLKLAGVSPRVVVNQIKGAVVHSPGGGMLGLAGDKTYALAVDRPSFDRELAEQARAAGVKICNHARFIWSEYLTDRICVRLTRLNSNHQLNNQDILYTCQLLIGADGQNSLVARSLGLPLPPERIFLYAVEAELSINDNFNDNFTAHIFLGRDIAPGWFGYLIPLGNGRARVGVGASIKKEDRFTQITPKKLFQKLIEKYPGIFGGLKTIRSTGGVVPLGLQKKTYGPRVMLVGDAASHVKPISGGGLFLGLMAAKKCAAMAVKALEKGDGSEKFLSAYQQAWMAEIGNEIICGLRHREVYLQLFDREMDLLVHFLNKPYWQKIILQYGDLDYHSGLAQKLILAPPWASRFIGAGLNCLGRFL